MAQDACAAAGVDPATLPSVFTSAHGDLAIVDALCRTLSHNPMLLSPMRFHHSVHNAASGYFAIGAHNRQPSTALAAGPCSFAAGWLEAATQCAADGAPVLLVGCDTEATGPLQSVNSSRSALAVALLLRPAPAGPQDRAVDWALQTLTTPPEPASGNAMDAARPLFDALADSRLTALSLPLSQTLALALNIAPA